MMIILYSFSIFPSFPMVFTHITPLLRYRLPAASSWLSASSNIVPGFSVRLRDSFFSNFLHVQHSSCVCVPLTFSVCLYLPFLTTPFYRYFRQQAKKCIDSAPINSWSFRTSIHFSFPYKKILLISFAFPQFNIG